MTKKIPPTSPITLASSRLEIGHCIIVDDCDQPSGKMLAVITHRDSFGELRCRYLNANSRFTAINKGDGISVLPVYATPVSMFGMRVLYDPVECKYWCEHVVQSTAKYPDGVHRDWQEWDGPWKYEVRPDVLAKALKITEVES